MNYRGKDTLAESLKNGLLNKHEKKVDPVTQVINITEAQARFEESIAKPTATDISSVAGALRPNRAAWAQKLYEENKPAPKVIVEQVEAPKKKSVQELAKGIHLNKVEEKPLIMNESTDSIASVLSEQGKRMWRPAKKETLEEKVSRLEAEISKKKLTEDVSRNRHNVHLEYDNAKGERKKQIIEINGKADHAAAAKAAREHYQAVDKGKNFNIKKVYTVGLDRDANLQFGKPVTDGMNEKPKLKSTFWKGVKKHLGMKEEVEQLTEFKKGEDIGKPGLNFKKVAAKASKEYGSKAAGKRVAGAVLQKILHKESLNEETAPKHKTIAKREKGLSLAKKLLGRK